jgi:hypothetical protein
MKVRRASRFNLLRYMDLIPQNKHWLISAHIRIEPEFHVRNLGPLYKGQEKPCFKIC